MNQLRREFWHFFVHLRCHYQVLVASGVYLLGGLYQPDFELPLFALQFVNVHVLLLGGATVYNSFFDRDEGPIGGLRHPPPLAAWTHPASVIVQFIGLLLGLLAGPLFVAVYAVSALLFGYTVPRLIGGRGSRTRAWSLSGLATA